MVSKQTMTLANGIVGVSVLAMPFCFKQCGIVLATTMLIVGAFMTRTVCYFLLKAGTITRRRNYEMLAWHTFGPGGKFIVEISIIGFLIGTLIAFFVVMGDLGPEIVSEIFAVENNSSLRNIIMAGLSLFVALPLGLLRNIDSLSSVSTASVLFYLFLVCKVFSEGLGPLFSGSYLDRVDYWRPAGVLQCIPIFSMALSCQTQIFGIYESLPDPSLQKMNEVVKHAVNICTLFYFCVGFFGYIAFANQSFGGNILMTFTPSGSTQLIKTCFLMSILFGVPLVIFPCRSSLNSLIFRRTHMHHSLHDISTNFIPDARLKCLTIGILGFCLIIGLLIPNIELVLGLVGSTTGSVICLIFPSIMFIRVTSKKTTERLLAQALFFIGVVIMIVSTYATLYAAEKAQSKEPIPEIAVPSEIPNILKKLEEKKINELNNKQPEKLDFHAEFNKFKSEPGYKPISKLTKSTEAPKVSSSANIKDSHEKVLIEPGKKDEEPLSKNAAIGKPDQLNVHQQFSSKDSKDVPPIKLVNSSPKADFQPVVIKESPDQVQASGIKSKDEGNKLVLNTNTRDLTQDKQEIRDPVAIPKEKAVDQIIQNQKKESIEVNNKPKEKAAVDEKNVAAVLLKKFEEHEENQKKFLEEQRQVLAELKEHHAQDVERQKVDDNVSKAKESEIAGGQIAPRSPNKLDSAIQQGVPKQNQDAAKLTKDRDSAKAMEERLDEAPKSIEIHPVDAHVQILEAKRDEPLAVNKPVESSSLKTQASNLIPAQNQPKTHEEANLKEIPESKVGEEIVAVLINKGNTNEVNSIRKENVESQLKSEPIKSLNILGDNNNALVIDEPKVNPYKIKMDKKTNQKVDRDI